MDCRLKIFINKYFLLSDMSTKSNKFVIGITLCISISTAVKPLTALFTAFSLKLSSGQAPSCALYIPINSIDISDNTTMLIPYYVPNNVYVSPPVLYPSMLQFLNFYYKPIIEPYCYQENATRITINRSMPADGLSVQDFYSPSLRRQMNCGFVYNLIVELVQASNLTCVNFFRTTITLTDTDTTTSITPTTESSTSSTDTITATTSSTSIIAKTTSTTTTPTTVMISTLAPIAFDQSTQPAKITSLTTSEAPRIDGIMISNKIKTGSSASDFNPSIAIENTIQTNSSTSDGQSIVIENFVDIR